MTSRQFRQRRRYVFAMKQLKTRIRQHAFVVSRRRKEAIDGESQRDFLIRYWTGQYLVGEEQASPRFKEARPLGKYSITVSKMRNCIKTNNRIEGIIGERHPLVGIVSLEADALAETELHRTRLRTADRLRIEFYASD